MARGGSGWTSMMIPSAPAAAPARAIGRTRERCPVPCDGSTMTGRWVRSRSTGTAVRSSVLRVDGSKVRMPRSHRTTLGLPAARMYSAAISHSSIVADRPRLSSTGCRLLADRLEQHEVLHVPGADLEHVDVVLEHRHVGGVGDLGHDGQAGLVAHVGEQLEALDLQPLERVRASCAA